MSRKRKRQVKPTLCDEFNDFNSTSSSTSSLRDEYEPPCKLSKTGDARSCTSQVKSCVCMDAENYKMNHARRGIAVIFNHYYCYGHALPRKGTDYDVKRLQNTFGDLLGFDVEVYHDQTRCQIESILEKLSKHDFRNEDCLAVFVLSHGSERGIEARDTGYPVEELWANFTPDKCASLAGKPKLFFINCCRGKKQDEGMVYYDYVSRRRMERDIAPLWCKKYRVPLWADFLMLYSSVEGYTSFRHPKHGTWFIQSLCDTLENDKYRKLELKHILTISIRKTALKCNEYSIDRTQIPSMTSTLMRNLYFE